MDRQLCGDYGPDHNTYHDESGKPVVDKSLFPNFKEMTDYAHSLGITAGYVFLSILRFLNEFEMTP